ncbi:MAG: 4Fe-4S cluster-binding domain-containing protein [Atopobiaceae bacterium]|nr:4Fe-4S cluster-binding domain-containing protein [Atopobiaceae bacterium]
MGFAERLTRMAAKPKLDVQVCDHCNLRCAGCLHFAPLAEERCLDVEEYERDLRRLASVEGIGGYFGSVVLMGGEPLLHPRLADVIHATRMHLPQQHVILCTNGLLLKRMGDDFWHALVQCDVDLLISPYPLRVDYEGLEELAREKGAHVAFAADITDTADGKETFLRLAIDPKGKCDQARSFLSCPFGGCYLQLTRGAIWPCQVSAHHGSLARRFGYNMHDSPADSLPLESIASTDDIETFRRMPHPMCRHCNNDALTVVPWERSRLAATEWLAPR